MKHRPGKKQRAILEAMQADKSLYRRMEGTWRLDDKPANRDACSGLFVYGYIIADHSDYADNGLWQGTRYVLTEQGKQATQKLVP
jgi:hypothetical protein